MRYTNLDPRHSPHRAAAVFRWSLGDRLLGRRRVSAPGPPVSQVTADHDLIADRLAPPRITWIGHSSCLISLGRQQVLIDPVFSRRIGLCYPRHGQPGMLPDDLPPLSLLLITHNHYDHLDAASIDALPRDVPVLVPAGLGRWFQRRGFARTTELKWWESVARDDLTVTFVPARHWSRRTPFDQNRSWWGGYVISDGTTQIYHAGDSAQFNGFAEIGRRFPNLNAALLPIGAYEPRWFMEHQHLNPEQATDALQATGAKVMLPLHYGTFQMTDEPLCEPLHWLERCWECHPVAERARLRLPAVGETVLLTD